jgi:uncharacterized RDD family membrane protein YckC
VSGPGVGHQYRSRSEPTGAHPTIARPPAAEPADLGGRLVALVVDSLAVVLIVTPVAVLAELAGGGVPGGIEVVLVWFVYRAIADGTGGSLGKRLLGMRVVGPGGGRAGLGAGAARNLWSLSAIVPTLVPPVIGNTVAVAVSVAVAITIARDPTERGWHDRLAGTAVVRPT